MLEREKQVVLTYTTWRWMWFFIAASLLFMALPFIVQEKTDGMPFLFGYISIGIPVVFCTQWFVAVSKWQFVNPRARLMPGYVRPHLIVISVILAMLLIVNPLLQAACQGTSPVGPLAFALLLGGLFLIATHFNHGALSVPAMIVFFSGMHPATSQFWYSNNSDYLTTHLALIIVGAALTAWWLWQLANLHEENEGYFVMPLGYPGSMSRLEGDIYRRWQGRKAARSGLWQMLADRWHDRLDSQATKPSQLADYGWGKIQAEYQAALLCIGLVLYCFLLDQLTLHWGNDSSRGPLPLLNVLVTIIPSGAATGALRRHRPRLAQELLRPANRNAYFKGMFRSMAKQTLLFWLAMTAGLWIVVISDPQVTGDSRVLQLASFTIWSLALQFPAIAIGLLLGRLRSLLLPFIGFAVLAVFGTVLMIYWNDVHKLGPLEYFRTLPTATAAALGFILLGLPLYIWARRSWLNAELG